MTWNLHYESLWSITIFFVAGKTIAIGKVLKLVPEKD